MQGPIAAAIEAGSAPSSTMAATVASITPATAPRQPAWAAPITPASVSANRIGAQSAVMMPRAMSGRSVTIASARGPSPGAHGCRHVHHIGAVHLHEADKAVRLGADRAGGAGAVLQHRVGDRRRRQAAVQAGVGAAGDAAVAGEETVRHAERIGGQRHDRI